MAVNVFDRGGDLQRDSDRPVGRKFSLLVQEPAKQAAFNPLHHHVVLTMMVVGENLHHARMIKLLADLLFTVESLEKDRICLHLRMRNFDRYPTTRLLVCGTEDGSHAATFNQVLNQIMVEFVAGAQ